MPAARRISAFTSGPDRPRRPASEEKVMRIRAILVLSLSLLHSNPRLSADAVIDWNAAALNAIRASNTPPPVAARNLAILHTAVYDAVNGITRTHEPYFVTGHVP